MRQDIAGKLVSFYRDGVPGYIRNAGRTFLKVHAGADFTGYQDIKITIGDVVLYMLMRPAILHRDAEQSEASPATGVRSIRLQKNALNGSNISILRGYESLISAIRIPHSTFHILQL